MRIIVTGACGFIGSVFALRAKERGHDVLGLDDESRGLNGPRLVNHGVKLLRHDCRGGLPDSVGKVDAIAHFAAGTGSLDRPIEELRELNVKMTLKMVADAQAVGASCFVWPTTSLALAVADSPYVQSKEEALKALLRMRDSVSNGGLRIVCCRFFNVAGAYKGLTERRKNEVHLLPTLVDCFRDKKALVINGTDYDTVDGTPSRDFVNVVDVADYLLDVTEDSTIPLYSSEDSALWVGTGHTLTVQQAVDVFEQYVGPVQTRLGPRRPFDTGEIRCQGDSVEKLTRWRPLVPAWVSLRDETAALLEP